MKGLDLLHLSYVKRWVVAPTHREQSVAEHTFRVVTIARALAMHLGLSPAAIKDVVEHAIIHDQDELMTGDIPGPAKSKQPGYLCDVGLMNAAQRIIKVADSIETGTFWVQWGNPEAWTGHEYNRAPARDIEKILHYSGKMDGLLEAADAAWLEITGKGMMTCG